MGPQQQRRLFSFILLWILFIPLIIRGDGKVFTQAIAIPANTPDQRALLYYSNGVERLVIETSFVGEGTNFAWVVPLPSVPKIEAVTENFFPSLSSAYQPKLLYRPTYFTHFCIPLAAILSISILCYRRKGFRGLGIWIVLILAVLFLVALILPNFVKARGMSANSPTASVTVIDQQKVGIYDTVTLSGTDGRELLEWLNKNQFHTPTNALSVLSDYAAKEWVFVAATMHREEEKSLRSVPHPLAFTFATEKPVYPLRLTGIENGSCAIELFVFGPERAEAEHFKAEYCGAPVANKALESVSYNGLFFPPAPGKFELGSWEVQRFALPAPVTTKLVGTLTPAQMESDSWIRWAPFKPLVPTLYSHDAAKSRAFDWFIGITVLGALWIQLRLPRITTRRAFCGLGVVIVMGIICALVRFVTLDVTEVRITRGGPHRMINDWHLLNGAVAQYQLERRELETLTFEELTNSLAKYVRTDLNNPISGKPLLNEKSPGNITLRDTTNGTEVIWYDIHANAHVMATFAVKPK